MNSIYLQQRELSDSYIPYVSEMIITKLNLDPEKWKVLVTSFEQDTQEAADLILTDGDKEYKIALRLRSNSYIEKYFFDFTIRHAYKNGSKTEYEKVLVGEHADLMFYGFMEGKKVSRWLMFSLDEFRNQHETRPSGRVTPQPHIHYSLRKNTDKINDFYAYDIMSFKNHEDLILIHSDGYFSDVISKKLGSLSIHKIKPKKERIDGY